MTYRSAIATFKSAIQQDLIESKHVNTILQLQKEIETYCPYKVKHKDNVALLDDWGVPHDTESPHGHLHGAHRNLENHLLRKVFKQLFKDKDVTYLFIKEHKLKQAGLLDSDAQINLLNFQIVAKDEARYQLDNQPLTEAMDAIMTSYAFMHDTIHNYDLDEVDQIFAMNPRLNYLYATVFAPPEILDKSPSLYPNLYTLSYHTDSEGTEYFKYIPENDDRGHYTQKLHITQSYLIYNKIVRRNSLSVTIVESYAAQHLLLVNRGDYLRSPETIYTYPEFTRLPTIHDPTLLKLNSTHFNRQILINVLAYVRKTEKSKKPDINAIFTNQLDKTYYDPSIVTYLVEVIWRLKQINYICPYYDNLSQDIRNYLANKTYRKIYNHTLGKIRDSCTGELLDALQLSAYEIKVKHETYDNTHQKNYESKNLTPLFHPKNYYNPKQYQNITSIEEDLINYLNTTQEPIEIQLRQLF
jgi:hypothetical protein